MAATELTSKFQFLSPPSRYSYKAARSRHHSNGKRSMARRRAPALPLRSRGQTTSKSCLVAQNKQTL